MVCNKTISLAISTLLHISNIIKLRGKFIRYL